MPKPAIEWSKDSNVFSSDLTQPIHAIGEGKHLKISSVQVTDAGIYVCKATNELGSSEVSYQVDVTQRPILINTETEVKEATSNKSFILECPIKDVLSLYNAKITWLYNLTPIDMDNKHFSTTDNKRKLYIEKYVRSIIVFKLNNTECSYHESEIFLTHDTNILCK